MRVWVDLGERVILSHGGVDGAQSASEGFPRLLELLLWEPLKSNGWKIKNYLKERQIYLDKLCYLHEKKHFVVVVNLHSRIFLH